MIDQAIEVVPYANTFLRKKAHPTTESDLVNNADNQGCIICLEPFKVNDGKDIVELDCSKKHVFHLNCMEKWVEKNNTCPMCREVVEPKNIEPLIDEE